MKEEEETHGKDCSNKKTWGLLWAEEETFNIKCIKGNLKWRENLIFFKPMRPLSAGLLCWLDPDFKPLWSIAFPSFNVPLKYYPVIPGCGSLLKQCHVKCLGEVLILRSMCVCTIPIAGHFNFGWILSSLPVGFEYFCIIEQLKQGKETLGRTSSINGKKRENTMEIFLMGLKGGTVVLDGPTSSKAQGRGERNVVECG